jgi:2-oxo-4-hydroxy-4-carboxy-5-ureidoimidazoline decarboxylase
VTAAAVTVAVFNELDEAAAVELLTTCCASREWAASVAAHRPFDGVAPLLEVAERRWTLLADAERLKAIEAHPPIGALAAARDRERREQAGAAQADQATREALAALNEDYRARFGFVFLTDASGRDASDMLAELRTRISNRPEQERAKAEEQQWRIMRRRLRRAIIGPAPLLVSTHVLDTAAGAPAAGVEVTISESADHREWTAVDTRTTDASGRVEGVEVPSGGWVRLTFATGGEFFGDVVVTFAAGDRERAHVPLLLAPFGYSTYLGS